jgi:mycothiol synthase
MMADAPAALVLLNAYDEVVLGMVETTLEDIEVEWAEQDFDLARDSWLVETEDGAAAGLATVHIGEDDPVEFDAYVHPEHWRRGIGALLVGLMEARAVEHAGGQGRGEVRVRNAVPTADERANELMRGRGYEHARHFWWMVIDLDERPPAPTWPEGMTMRAFVPGQDERATFETVTEAFGEHWGQENRTYELWAQSSFSRESFDPSLWFIVEEGGQMAAASLNRTRPDRGWVQTLAVRKPWRGRGLGMCLLQAAFREFYDRGQRRVGLSVDSENTTGATRLYERAGMRVEREFDFYEKTLLVN